MKKYILLILSVLCCQLCSAFGFLIPMDETQKNHLKAYGIAYWVLQNNITIDWLLNYRGGSFLMEYSPDIKKECDIRGVSYEIVADVKISSILAEVSSDDVNMDAVKLEKAPKWRFIHPKTNCRGTMR